MPPADSPYVSLFHKVVSSNRQQTYRIIDKILCEYLILFTRPKCSERSNLLFTFYLTFFKCKHIIISRFRRRERPQMVNVKSIHRHTSLLNCIEETLLFFVFLFRQNARCAIANNSFDLGMYNSSDIQNPIFRILF